MVNTYGCPAISPQASQAEAELGCFYHAWPEEKGGLGRYGHLHNAIDLIYNRRGPVFIWNEWSEWMMEEFCYNREVTIAGAGATWKTTCMAGYGHMRWLASPAMTRGVFTSTTMQALRSKLWKDVLKFHRAADEPFGNVVNHPQPKIQTFKGNDGFGLFGIAVESGDVEKAVENIKGMHAPDTFVMIDEPTGVSWAIVEAGANLEKGTHWYQLVNSGNPVSYFDSHGKLAEPENGWSSVNAETGKWKTKRGGVCIHLDGLKSPNVKANKKKYPGMLSAEDVEISRQRDGENSPTFWSQVRGFWAPEGITKTVVSETMLMKFGAKDKAIWIGEPMQGMCLDPSFGGGDRCTLRFPKCGEVDGGKRVISFGPTLVLKLDVMSKEPIHYQIARRVKDEGTARTIPPHMFATDASGEGGGLADIISREWSSEILRVEFGGRASDMPVSDINPRPSHEEYYNRVTELWFYFRTLLQQGAVRDLDDETAQEFCKRYFEMRGTLIMLESKIIMKARTGRSPDYADNAAIGSELFRRRGFIGVSGQAVEQSTTSWKEFARKVNVPSAYAA